MNVVVVVVKKALILKIFLISGLTFHIYDDFEKYERSIKPLA